MRNLQQRFLLLCVFRKIILSISILFVILFFNNCFSQDKNIFFSHLYKNALYEECVGYFQLLPPAQYTDSILYYTGCSWLSINRLGKSQELFSQIRSDSILFQAGMGQLALAALPEDAMHAVQVLAVLPHASTSDSLQQFHHLLYAGSALLAKQPAVFRSVLSSTAPSKISVLATLQESLWVHYEQYMQLPRKKPWIAGTLSAIIPGAGKYYVGKKRSAYAAFLQQLVLAGLVWDTWHIDKRFSPQMLIASSLFTVFYVGNIWGSTLSVGIHYREKFDTFKQSLLLDLRLPVRYFYP